MRKNCSKGKLKEPNKWQNWQKWADLKILWTRPTLRDLAFKSSELNYGLYSKFYRAKKDGKEVIVKLITLDSKCPLIYKENLNQVLKILRFIGGDESEAKSPHFVSVYEIFGLQNKIYIFLEMCRKNRKKPPKMQMMKRKIMNNWEKKRSRKRLSSKKKSHKIERKNYRKGKPKEPNKWQNWQKWADLKILWTRPTFRDLAFKSSELNSRPDTTVSSIKEKRWQRSWPQIDCFGLDVSGHLQRKPSQSRL